MQKDHGFSASRFDLSKNFDIEYQREVPACAPPYACAIDETTALLDELVATLVSPEFETAGPR